MNINTIYLLTGAAGFLGINICTQLIERGGAHPGLRPQGGSYPQVSAR